MKRNDPQEPPVVLPPLNPSIGPSNGEEIESSHLFRDAGEWLDRVMGTESYGAPRVFDLFTLLAITLAFALLLASLRLIEPLLLDDLETVAITLGMFVTGIALFQMALWGGKKPRLASLVAGPILWLLIFVALNLSRLENLLSPAYLLLGVFTAIFGIPAGYLGGAMVAGVFLLADFFRTKYLHKPKNGDPDNDDQIFAEESPTSEKLQP